MNTEAKLRDYLKRVTADLRQTRHRLTEVEAAAHEPVAIVAMSCRLPGGISSPEDLWDTVAAGRDVISPFPADRGWDLDSLYDADPDQLGRSYVREGGFLTDVARFDAAFFEISPREALAMAPQQRLLLESSWEAIERAGIDPLALRGTRTGVFVGATNHDYAADPADVPPSLEGHVVLGTSSAVMSGRVAYCLGLEGPAITVDTMCSSSLVALHLATGALRRGECSMALAAGVTVLATPMAFVEFSRQRALSPDGRCRPFAAEANGTGWSEGVAVLVLERLADARRNGHPVLAVVRGSAINSDGASNGLTAPNGLSQQRVIRAALADAQLAATDVDVVEAHGTGTRLGDPIEAQALQAVYGRDRPADRPLWLGSVKSNIGHGAAVSGLTGVIKMVLAMGNGSLPRTLYADEPSPHVDWSAAAVKLLTDPVAWSREAAPRRAAVSSFGASGTNAHAILEEPEPVADLSAAPADSPDPAELPALPLDGGVLWVLSGRGEQAVRAQAERLRGHVADRPDVDLAEVGFALATTRSAFEYRAGVVARDRDGFLAGLAALAAADPAPNVVRGQVRDDPRPVFVFPGQGSQWTGMALELLEASPVFRARMSECAAALAPYTDWSLSDVLRGAPGAPPLERVDVVQPALFAVMVSLAALWRDCGVEPAAVVGHSQGEIAAACVAGALTLSDAARVVAVRGRILRAELAGRGAMVSVARTPDQVAADLAAWGERVCVAAINGPRSVIVSGDPGALAAVTAGWAAADVRFRSVPVDYASHSAQVEGIRDRLLAALGEIRPRTGDIPFVSTLTGAPLDTAGLDADYWVRNLREPVLFEQATRALIDDGHQVFIEVSAHPVLTMAVEETAEQVEAADVIAFGSLRRDDGGQVRFLTALAEAHAHGVSPRWQALFRGTSPCRVDLPTYAFGGDRYWLSPSSGRVGGAADVEPASDAPHADVDAALWDAVERDDAAAVAAVLDVPPGEPLDALVPALGALASWRRRVRDRKTASSWRYRVDWRPLGELSAAGPTGAWLALVPAVEPGIAASADADAAATVLSGMAARGATVRLVPVPASVERADLANLLADAGRDGAYPTGVLSLLALDDAPHPRHPEISAGLGLTALTVQALDDADLNAALWVLTRSAVSTGRADPPDSPAQAAVWGLARCAALEHPRRWGGLLDLPAALDERAVGRVCAVLGGAGDEDQLAVRPDGVFVRRLVHAPDPALSNRADHADAGAIVASESTTPEDTDAAFVTAGHSVAAKSAAESIGAGATGPWRPRGTILITGGTGAVGGHVAGWLARAGAEHLVLASRRGEQAPGAAELAARLRAAGARVTLARCDVAEAAEVRALVAQVEAGGDAIRAVLHTAGGGVLAPLTETTLAEVAEAARAKASGAAALDEVFDQPTLDAFVLFSSISAVWGSGIHGGYAAANAYLDALAERRRARGLAATSIAWGIWNPADGGGMAAALAEDQLRASGIPFMPPPLALAAFGRVLDLADTAVVVAAVDWERFVPVFTSAGPRPLLDGLPQARRLRAQSDRAGIDGAAEPDGTTTARATPAGSALRDLLAALPAADRDRAVLDLVRTQVAEVLGYPGADAVDPGRALRELGFDSLTAVDLRNRLGAVTGLRLPVTLVFDHPTAAQLGRHLRVLADGTSAETAAPAGRPAAGAAPAPPADEPIAIVAMACRLPGGVRTPEALWELLERGDDVIVPFPTDRGWDPNLFDDDPDRAGHSYTREGGFLLDAGHFDAGFFGISPREAVAMDPQQRLLLATTWEAVERAGIDPSTLRGSDSGVFVGSSYQGYGGSMERIPPSSEGHFVTGSSASVLSGRIAYTLGLEGPAVTVDTACSSSLVALHLAVQSLRAGECSLALTAGAAVVGAPVSFVEFSRQRGLSADGRCKAFAAAADGVGLGEGVGVLLVERLSDARRAGHPVLAIIRGSATNQDGASNGLSAPSGPAQRRVIRAALAAAGLAARDVDAVEAHGTGTTLGDPIEAEALLDTYGQDRPETEPLLVGSLKSNIGHPQAASGVAGVIKTVLALRHGVLPRTLHVDAPTPYVDWSSGAVRLLTEALPWPDRGRPRRAGVSSFGLSGTNAHVILEQADPEPSETAPAETVPAEPGVVAWVLSARDGEALTEQAARLATELRAHPEHRVADVGHALVRTRMAFNHRAAVVGADREELLAGLASLADGGATASGGVATAATVRAKIGSGPGAVFVFPGQGGQWVGMAVELLDTDEVFRERLTDCARVIDPLVDWSLLDVVRGVPGAPSTDLIEVLQPVLFAVMVSLAAVWRARGVEPVAVVGSSQGEVAAACVAGALSLRDAAEVMVRRSWLFAEELVGRGAIASVALPEEALRERLAPWQGRLVVSGVNGPRSTAVAGEVSALVDFVAECEAVGVRARLVRASVASHCAQVEPLRERMTDLLDGIRPMTGEIPFYSTVTGERIDGATLGSTYWYDNSRQPVSFERAVRRLLADGYDLFVEMSPHPVLTMAVQEIAEDAGTTVATVGSLRRGDGGPARLLTALAEAYVHGARVDWTAVLPPASNRRTALPTYPFQERRYWVDTAADAGLSATEVGGSRDATDDRFWAAVEKGDAAALATTMDLDSPASAAPLLPALDLLATWRRRRTTRSTVDSWRYDIAWSPLPDTPGVSRQGVDVGADGAGPWLVVCSPGTPVDGLVEGVAAALGGEGAVSRLTLTAGAGRDDVAAGLRAALADRSVTGVLSLLALGAEADSDDGDSDVGGRGDDDGGVVPVGFALTVALLQALGDLGLAAPVWCATRGAVSVGRSDRRVEPGQALYWGLGRVAAMEYPHRWGGLVDLPPTLDERAAGRLRAVLTGDDDQVALRPVGAYQARLVRAPSRAAVPAAWRPDGTVLITGGTGTLGQIIARSLAREGAHLLLISRQGRDAPGAADLAAELTALGASVTIVACDAADREALAAVLAAVPADAPLTAVVHTAGVLDDGLIDTLTAASAAKVLRPKTVAARNLDELTRDHDVRAFVLFSSLAGTLGGPGQGSYAAANAYLDALARRRRAEGLAATSVAWGSWGGGGLLTADLADQLRLRGIPAMDPDLAVTALRDAVGHDDTFTVIADIDWDRAVAALRAARIPAALTDLPEVRRARSAAADASTAAADPDAADGASPLARTLAALDPDARERHLSSLIRTQVAAVLGYAGADDVDPNRALRDLGFDSLTAVDLRNRLGAASGLPLPVTLVFDYPTVVDLSRYVRDALIGAAGPASDSPSAPVPTMAAGDDPIVIVAMSCRLPGGVHTPEQLWSLLRDGADVIGAFPTDRDWDVEGSYDPDPDTFGTYYARGGGFLHDSADFDPDFFGISPREALAMDPQQRLLLETSWEVLERGGIDPESVRGEQVGVYVGSTYNDYGVRLPQAPEGLEGYLATGSASSVASGRIAYTLGLEGPAVTIDTACSSALVAIHLAARALRAGECSMAIAGGVAVMSTMSTFVEFSRQRAMSPDGRCKAFSAAADGAGWSEGVGLLLLERLSDARRAGHPVLAVIRGSAMNQDGASNGLTAPNGLAQQRVIRQALADARLTSADVDVVEAHGTGTTLGDPIEAGALLATYGRDRSADRPLWLGALKSNIGHTQAASGVAGVIKMVLAMCHELLPRTLHADEPTPHVDWSAGTVRLLTAERDWPAAHGPRRAAVSSFGISGTNAHLLLESAPDDPAVLQSPACPDAPAGGEVGGDAPVRAAEAEAAMTWPLSARSEPALAALAGALLTRLDGDGELGLADVGFSLATTRAALPLRAAAVGTNRDGISAALAALTRGETDPGLIRGTARPGGRTAFLFSGQGAQRAGAGHDLWAAHPLFADNLDAVCAHLDPHLGPWTSPEGTPAAARAWSLREVMFAPAGSAAAAALDRTEYTQPALFALEVALFRLVESWGIVPDLLLGHSVGELAAAHVAGVLSLADACALVAARGRLMGGLPAGGAMLSVAADEGEVTEDLAGLSDQVGIAALNGPRATVVSGDADVVDELAARWTGQGRRVRRLRVSHAFHSPRMDPMLDEFAALARALDYAPPTVPVVSNVTGRLATADELTSPDYWVRHVRLAVRFADGIRHSWRDGATAFLELGPDAVLTAMGEACLDDQPATRGATPVWASALRRDLPEDVALATAVARLHAHGVPVDWRAVHAGGAVRVDLPTYPFQRRRYWLEVPPSVASDAASVGLRPGEHPLLGAAVDLPDSGGHLFTGLLSLRTQPWLADHAVGGTAILPGTAFLELAARAGERLGCARVDELTLQAPLVLAGAEAVCLQLAVGAADGSGARPLTVYARPVDAPADDVWTRHAVGTLTPTPTGATPAAGDLASWPPAGAEPLDVEDLYDRLAANGFGYGPVFQGLRAAWRRGEEVFAEASLPAGEQAAAAGFGLHPALLDAALHAIAFTMTDGDRGVLPFSWTGVDLPAVGVATLRVQITPTGRDTLAVRAADVTGRPVAAVDSLVLRPVAADVAQATRSAATRDALFRLAWTAVAPIAGGAAGAGASTPDPVIASFLAPAGSAGDAAARPGGEMFAGTADAVRETTHRALELVQDWLSDLDASPGLLVFVTRGAVAADSEDPPADLVGAAVWGLVRSAQVEHPGRFALVDLDPRTALADGDAVPAEVIDICVATGEPQLAVRAGECRAARLARVQPSAPPTEPAVDTTPAQRRWDPAGTVLVTGATGTLGGLVARHLVTARGMRHLLLVGRRGLGGGGAADLVADLTALGATVTTAAVDVTDREALAALLTAVPAEHPLTAVVHTAGVLDDGVVAALTAERIDPVLRPKVDAVLHLHELTRDRPLAGFVLFSSLAGTFGGSGQANYAAGNAFLDAFAAHRRALGLPAVSMGWGLWERRSAMTGKLDGADLRRLSQGGIVPMPDAMGLALFDAALTRDEPTILTARLDLAAVRRAPGPVPWLYRDLVRVARTPGTGGGPGVDPAGDLRRRLAERADPGERAQLLVDFVRAQAAGVLGHSDPAALDVDRGLLEIGFDSLSAVDLRNRLGAATGLRLPATLLFDYPTVGEIADHLGEQIIPAPAGTTVEPGQSAGLTDLDRLEKSIDRLTERPGEAVQVSERLRGLLARLEQRQDPDGTATRIGAASDDEIFAFIDNELGSG
ncbi:type I polyketide synthase [Frankia sp. AgB32]|uniref:type I polyketide synthase n=1 Tax=Frankia sp. AgB32 TaxID=631119 RepID=UPI00200DC9FD|nr:type I polyketide synthase [Frankia sp. AgB32]MCK9896148.1 SDR family NAD(P)-dependent oxidoreductase [Frankia sp. AgB32]